MSKHEPRLIWVTMIDRPFTTDIKQKKILGLKYRFNEILRNMVEKEKYYYILQPKIPVDNPHAFTVHGKLSEQGKKIFWLEIDRQLRLFDRHDIKLTAEEMKKFNDKQRKSKIPNFTHNHRPSDTYKNNDYKHQTGNHNGKHYH